MLDCGGKTNYFRSALMDKVYDLKARTPEELLEEQIGILNALTDAVAEAHP